MLERSKQFRERFQETAQAAQTVETGHEWLVQKGLGRWLFALILGVGLALVGPYGTYVTMGLPLRFAYWIGLIMSSFAIWWAIELIVGRIFGQRDVIFKQLTVIVPFAAVNSLLLMGVHAVINSVTGQAIPTSWSSYFVSHIILSTLVIAPLILLTITLMTQVEARASGDTIQFLTQALPPPLRGQTPYALAAEGHYVRVHTKLGEALVTMRFEDALRALSGVDGIQTHRSWWVARDEILEVKPVGSAFEASLRCGMRVPISRRRKTLVARGLTHPGAASAY